MIKRKNFLTSLSCIILAVATALCLLLSGCAEYTPPQGSGDGDDPLIPSLPSTPTDPTDDYDGFSVQLIIESSENVWQNFTKEYYEVSDGNGGAHDAGWTYWDSLKVQWTDRETNARYTAGLDEDGKAVRDGLDGDYKVTLTSLPTGFTYEPNENYADNITKQIQIKIYKILAYGRQGSLRIDGSLTGYYLLNSTGTYRLTFTSPGDSMLCALQVTRQGVYSLTTLADVTADLVNPKLSVYSGNLTGGFAYWFADKDDGGASNTYTKNIYWQYNISASEATGSNAFLFRLYSESLDGSSGYPITLDFIIRREGDYSNTSYDTETVPVTEDFTKTPAAPEGTFTWCARSDKTEGLVLDQTAVILNTEKGRSGKTVEMGAQATLDDGYYYYYDLDEASGVYTLTDRVYAAVNMDNEIMEFTDFRVSFKNLEGYNYTNFVAEYRKHCVDGCYPLNDELRLFLQRFAVAGRYFNDGAGMAETASLSYIDKDGNRAYGGYVSDEDSMWMFACGYFKQ